MLSLKPNDFIIDVETKRPGAPRETCAYIQATRRAPGCKAEYLKPRNSDTVGLQQKLKSAVRVAGLLTFIGNVLHWLTYNSTVRWRYLAGLLKLSRH